MKLRIAQSVSPEIIVYNPTKHAHFNDVAVKMFVALDNEMVPYLKQVAAPTHRPRTSIAPKNTSSYMNAKFKSHDIFLMIEDTTTVIGIASLSEHNDLGIGVLAAIYISPDYRKRGYGRQLIDFVKTWNSRQRHRTQLMLSVFNENMAALALYRSIGFQPYLTELVIET